MFDTDPVCIVQEPNAAQLNARYTQAQAAISQQLMDLDADSGHPKFEVPKAGSVETSSSLVLVVQQILREMFQKLS